MDVPAGQAVRYDAAVVPVAVTLATTAVAPIAGTPPLDVPEGVVPATSTVRVPPAVRVLPPHWASVPASPVGFPALVSHTR